MNDKIKNEFEKWFNSADDHKPIDLFRDDSTKETIRLGLWENILSATVPKPKKQFGNFWWMKVAAVLFLFSMATLWIYKQQPEAPIRVRLQSYSTKNGELKKILLPDSSQIWLNGGTQIRVPEKFAKLREVYLDNGEVFFLVKKDASRPFVVHSQQLNTRVLGTSFNIRSYTSEPGIQVSVKTGKVQVTEKTGKQGIILLPAEQLNYSLNGKHFNKSTIDLGAINGWIEHRLYYNRTELGKILADLERQYGVVFQAENPGMLSCLYTTSFENLPLEQVLLKLKMLGSLEFEHKKNIIYLKGKGCL